MPQESFDELTIDGQRRAGGDELLLAQLAPEVVRDDGPEGGAVFRDSLRAAGARDDGGRGWVSEREPQRGGLDGNPVALGEGLDALDLGQDLWGRLLVLEVAPPTRTSELYGPPITMSTFLAAAAGIRRCSARS